MLIANQRARDFIVNAARGLLMFPFFVAAAGLHHSLAPALLLIAGALGQAVAFDVANHVLIPRKLDGSREWLTGAIWGAAYWAVLA